MYEPEDGENAPGLGSNSEVTTGEVSTAQLPVIVSGCFITTSGITSELDPRPGAFSPSSGSYTCPF